MELTITATDSGTTLSVKGMRTHQTPYNRLELLEKVQRDIASMVDAERRAFSRPAEVNVSTQLFLNPDRAAEAIMASRGAEARIVQLVARNAHALGIKPAKATAAKVLRDEGVSYRAIGKALGVSSTQAYRLVNGGGQ